MKLLHLGCADDIRPGFDNLDPKINGWTFESGLPYPDHSVDGITISHALMYVNIGYWGFVMREFYRVLVHGGVVRITEDDCESPESPRFWKTYGMYPGASSYTGSASTRESLEEVGFTVFDCSATETQFRTNDLLIAHREHKVPKYVFYIEGVKK